VLRYTAVRDDGTDNGLLSLSWRSLKDGLVLDFRTSDELFDQVLLGRSSLVLGAADSRSRCAIVLAALGSSSAALSDVPASNARISSGLAPSLRVLSMLRDTAISDDRLERLVFDKNFAHGEGSH